MADKTYKRIDLDQLNHLLLYLFTKLKSEGWQADTNTTYSITQDATDGHKFTLTGSDGSSATITIPDNDTKYSDVTETVHGLMTAAMAKKLNRIADGANKTVVDAALSNTSTNPVQNKAVQGELAKKAPSASPALTGTPTAPTAASGTDSTQIATTAFVMAAVNAAFSKITDISFSVVTALPETGKAGVFYLMAHSHSDSNDGYDEYVWLSDKGAFEKIGNTDVDLSGYVKSSQLVAMTNTELESAVDTAYTSVFGS